MRVISEAVLRGYSTTRLPSEDLIDKLLEECQELQEPWIPIDDAPKDRRLLIFVPGAYGCEIGWWVSDRNRWSCHPFLCTHYQELPDDPVMPIHKPETSR